jgi:hypothetical protein
MQTRTSNLEFQMSSDYFNLATFESVQNATDALEENLELALELTESLARETPSLEALLETSDGYDSATFYWSQVAIADPAHPYARLLSNQHERMSIIAFDAADAGLDGDHATAYLHFVQFMSAHVDLVLLARLTGILS